MDYYKDDPLSEEERGILKLLAEDYSVDEIAGRIGYGRTTTHNKIAHIRDLLEVKNTSAAVAIYANKLGLKGTPITLLEPDYPQEFFMRGSLTYRALILSDALTRERDVDIMVSKQDFQPSPSQKELIDTRLPTFTADAQARSIPWYDGKIFVVSALIPGHETYRPITLHVRRSSFFTVEPIRRSVSYKLNPRSPQESDLPIPISASLYIVAGNNPAYLMVARRSKNLAFYPTSYGASISGLCEPDNDEQFSGKLNGNDHLSGNRLDFINTIWRELGEEKSYWARSKIEFGNHIELLTLSYDYEIPAYDIMGLIELPNSDPEEIRQRIGRAKEGIYEKLEFPTRPDQLHLVKSICDSIKDNVWVPMHAMSLITLLERRFPVEIIFQLLSR